MENLAVRLERLMHGRGISKQSHLARETGLAQSTINRLLTRGDNYRPGVETIQRLADYFRVSPDWLARGRGSPVPATVDSVQESAELMDAMQLYQAPDAREVLERYVRLDPEGRAVVLELLRWIDKR